MQIGNPSPELEIIVKPEENIHMGEFCHARLFSSPAPVTPDCSAWVCSTPDRSLLYFVRIAISV